MGIKRYSNCIERFLSGEKGERFFNIAYSLGAAVVIWGALFEILHLSGGKTLLCIGISHIARHLTAIRGVQYQTLILYLQLVLSVIQRL